MAKLYPIIRDDNWVFELEWSSTLFRYSFTQVRRPVGIDCRPDVRVGFISPIIPSPGYMISNRRRIHTCKRLGFPV
ncbi:hypothetical protein RSAG8_12672, partial [Rhizoctonia solani AG-8 WAC10335]